MQWCGILSLCLLLVLVLAEIDPIQKENPDAEVLKSDRDGKFCKFYRISQKIFMIIACQNFLYSSHISSDQVN